MVQIHQSAKLAYFKAANGYREAKEYGTIVQRQTFKQKQEIIILRAVGRNGNSVDFRLSPKRDVAAAKAFLRKAIKTQGRAPVSVTLRWLCGASHRAVREMPAENDAWQDTKLRSMKYLNNMIEQIIVA